MKGDKDLKRTLNNENGEFDIFSPSSDHKFNFLQKLNEQQKSEHVISSNKTRNWYRKLSIAASVALFIGVSLMVIMLNKQPQYRLANVSPEMEKTENFFHNAIEHQIEQIKKNSSEANTKIVEDGMQQLNKLEEDYKELEKDLFESDNNPKVISAMISNFQKRIDLLENIQEKITNYSLQKNINNENKIL